MSDLVISGVGDVAPKRARPIDIFSAVRDELIGTDVLFGQMECPVSDRGLPSPDAKLAMRTSADVAPVLADVGFDVMSIAGNHCMDFGAVALADTIEHLERSGIRCCGAGGQLNQARRPAIIEAKGRRTAFLAYSSILPAGYAAESNRPGCAPLRAYTHYEQIEPDQPGTPARIHTFPDPADMNALLADIAEARRQADIVVLSMHWGIHFVRASLADYQREVAHLAIEHGADIIFGHHPHLLKGVEIYCGRPIFYSLGNFAIEQPSAFKEDVHLDRAFADISALSPGWKPTERYMAPPETRHTGIARCTVRSDGSLAASLLPCRIDDDSRPEPLKAGDPHFAELFDYLVAITAEAGLHTRYRCEGDEILIAAA